MVLNLGKFFRACSPAYRLNMSNPEDSQYYIDFSAVRGSHVIKELRRSITLSADEPTCQLFTGHIGCGKSTELSCLQSELEQLGFHVVYFESSQDLDMADVDVSDILLAIAISPSVKILKRLKFGSKRDTSQTCLLKIALYPHI